MFHQDLFPWSFSDLCRIRGGGSRDLPMNPFRGRPQKHLNLEQPSTIVLLTLGVLVGCFLVPSLAQVLALTLICYSAYLSFSRV